MARVTVTNTSSYKILLATQPYLFPGQSASFPLSDDPNHEHDIVVESVAAYVTFTLAADPIEAVRWSYSRMGPWTTLPAATTVDFSINPADTLNPRDSVFVARLYTDAQARDRIDQLETALQDLVIRILAVLA